MDGQEATVSVEKVYNETEAFIENNRLMQAVVQEMKIIPQLPSEQPKDINPLQRVEFPEEGGVLTYMGGYNHPYKGFPFFEFVDKVDVIKKIQRGVLSSLYHSLKEKRWKLLGLIFVPWLFGVLVRAFVYTFYRMVDRFKIKPIRYCTALRELHRVFTIEWHGEPEKEKEMRTMVRDVMCMFLEFDNAYRFRFQDIIVELNKENLKNDPGKEVVRLLQLMSSREKTQEIKDTWKLVTFFFPLYLKFNKSLKKSIIGILGDLDLKKLELSVEDKTFCEKRVDYQFKFMENVSN